MDREELLRRVAAIPWYHAIDLGGGVVTPGPLDLRPYLPHYGLPDRLDGMEALDVGTASGFFAFEFERRGAKRVVAVDLPRWEDHDFLPAWKAHIRSHPEAARADVDRKTLHGPFELAREALGSRVERVETPVHDLGRAGLGAFDLVFCGSLLMHVRDPAGACAALRAVTRGTCFVATSTIDGCGEEPLARFVGQADQTNRWRLSARALEEILRAAGFARVERVSRIDLRSRDGSFVDPHVVVRAFPSP